MVKEVYMVNDDTPTYNLKAVVQETGLKPDTLRAWERRYGVPSPDRSTGGHRLYSQQDINILKWMLERQNEGMSISRAVSLWRGIAAEGRDPLHVMPLHSNQAMRESFVEVYSPVELGETIVELRRSWIEACMAFDERKAELVLSQAFAYYSPELVCFELLQKGLAQIGDGWYEGRVTVQQEHFASALAMRRLNTLLAASPAPTRAGRIVVGCPPGDNHTFSPLMLTYLLRRRGWDVVYLGGDVPINRLKNTIVATRPELVVFSAQLLETAATLLDVAVHLRSEQVPLAYGGYVFNVQPVLRRRIPGHFLGVDMSKTPDVIEHLMTARPPVPETVEVSEAYQQALVYFRERAGLLESHVWQVTARPEIGEGELADVSHYLTRSIIAGLKLGDLQYIGSDLKWVQGLMINYNMPPEQLCDFLIAYHKAAWEHLNAPAGRSVVEWLEQVVAACQESLMAGQTAPA